MTTQRNAGQEQPTAADATRIRELLIAGRALDALAGTEPFVPFEEWSDPRARRAAEWL